MRPRPCDRCPCKLTCLRWPGFCRMAAKEPQDPVEMAHIRNRSAMGPQPARPAVDYSIPPSSAAGRCCG